MALRTPSVLVSTSNEFDNLARYMRHIELSHCHQQQHQQQVSSAFIAVHSEEPRDTDDFAET